jgi:hypothetical protein
VEQGGQASTRVPACLQHHMRERHGLRIAHRTGQPGTVGAFCRDRLRPARDRPLHRTRRLRRRDAQPVGTAVSPVHHVQRQSLSTVLVDVATGLDLSMTEGIFGSPWQLYQIPRGVYLRMDGEGNEFRDFDERNLGPGGAGGAWRGVDRGWCRCGRNRWCGARGSWLGADSGRPGWSLPGRAIDARRPAGPLTLATSSPRGARLCRRPISSDDGLLAARKDLAHRVTAFGARVGVSRACGEEPR